MRLLSYLGPCTVNTQQRYVEVALPVAAMVDNELATVAHSARPVVLARRNRLSITGGKNGTRRQCNTVSDGDDAAQGRREFAY